MNGATAIPILIAAGALIALAVWLWPDRDDELAGVDEWDELRERLRPDWWPR